jgi:hypothetical protein
MALTTTTNWTAGMHLMPVSYNFNRAKAKSNFYKIILAE